MIGWVEITFDRAENAVVLEDKNLFGGISKSNLGLIYHLPLFYDFVYGTLFNNF
jgi:hypothetical protein